MTEGEISVYGGFPAGAGIGNVGAALRAGFPSAEVCIDDFGGERPALLFRLGPVFFATLFMDEEDVFLFDGGVPGPLEDAVAFVRRLSDCLAAAGLEHDFHVARGPMDYAASFVYPPEVSEPG
jgi:hypothetical protein